LHKTSVHQKQEQQTQQQQQQQALALAPALQATQGTHTALQQDGLSAASPTFSNYDCCACLLQHSCSAVNAAAALSAWGPGCKPETDSNGT
jgi:hypothetical protein